MTVISVHGWNEWMSDWHSLYKGFIYVCEETFTERLYWLWDCIKIFMCIYYTSRQDLTLVCVFTYNANFLPIRYHTPHCTPPHCATPHCATPHCTTLLHTSPYHTTLHHTTHHGLQTFYQFLNFGMIVSSALMIWKGLMVVTGSESPIVVVLR